MSSDTDPTYPGGFPAILDQMEGRRKPLTYEGDETLPPLDLDFTPLKSTPVTENDSPSQSGFARKRRELILELMGQPELLLLHGLLIANLRKRSQPEHTAALFCRLWAEEHAFLLDHLDARWLVSAITTFGEHGQTEAQRRIGTALDTLFNTMKLYESERLYSGSSPDQPFAWKSRTARELALQMDPYAVAAGGLDINLLGRLWTDAGSDRVIEPLARHLLTLLIHDPRTVFRRLRTMRKRRERQKAAEAKAAAPKGMTKRKRGKTDSQTAPVHPARVKTNPAAIRWGTVSLVKAPLPAILRFAAYHLGLGAARVHLYLDAPEPETLAALALHPNLSVTACDATWWARQSKSRMEAHQMRQSFVATQCYAQSDLDWLAHIDVDEFLLPPEGQSMAELLASTPADQAALVLPPAEQLAPASNSPTAHFKLTPRSAGHDSSLLTHIYPTFGDYLRGGFISHLEGKAITRTGIANLRIGIHAPLLGGAAVANRLRSSDCFVGHAHAPDWDSFLRHLTFRLDEGSYRKPAEGEDFRLQDLLRYLRDSEGEKGLRAFFQEVCTATPRLLTALSDNDMLITRDLALDAATEAQFAPLLEHGQ